MSPYPGYNNSNQAPYPEGGLQLPYTNSKYNGRLVEQSPYSEGLSSGYGISNPTPISSHSGSQTTFGNSQLTSKMTNLPVKQGDHKPYPGSYGAYPGSQSNYTGFSKRAGRTLGFFFWSRY